MKVPAELISQWLKDWGAALPEEDSTEYIAQRAAEWALQQPVSMEPVAAVRWNDIGHVTWHTDELLPEDTKLYTAAQLAQARQQGADEERKKWREYILNNFGLEIE